MGTPCFLSLSYLRFSFPCLVPHQKSTCPQLCAQGFLLLTQTVTELPRVSTCHSSPPSCLKLLALFRCPGQAPLRWSIVWPKQTIINPLTVFFERGVRAGECTWAKVTQKLALLTSFPQESTITPLSLTVSRAL